MTALTENRLGRQHLLPDTIHTVGAIWSPCHRYRYGLWRLWGGSHQPMIAAYIGMNPSSADEYHDDATVQKCRGFAMRWGYEGMLMLNAWAIRGTDPAEALQADQDPIGPENDGWIRDFAQRGYLALDNDQHAPIGVFIAAWGNEGQRMGRSATVTAQATQYRPLHCLGTTQQGEPKHPSRIAYATPVTLYHPRGTPR